MTAVFRIIKVLGKKPSERDSWKRNVDSRESVVRVMTERAGALHRRPEQHSRGRHHVQYDRLGRHRRPRAWSGDWRRDQVYTVRSTGQSRRQARAVRLHGHPRRSADRHAGQWALPTTLWSVCLSVCHDRESCKNWWTDRDAVWVVDSGGPKEPCTRWGPDPPCKGAIVRGKRRPIVSCAKTYRDIVWDMEWSWSKEACI